MEIGIETRKQECRRILQELQDNIRCQNWQQTMMLAEELQDHACKIVAREHIAPLLEQITDIQRRFAKAMKV